MANLNNDGLEIGSTVDFETITKVNSQRKSKVEEDANTKPPSKNKQPRKSTKKNTETPS